MESMETDFKKMIDDKIKEEQLVQEKKVLTARLKFLIIEIVIGLVGWLILIYQLGWLIGLSIMLIISGNNLGLMRRVYTERKNIFKIIWKDR